MSIYRDPRSPFWQFDFQIKRHRAYGSTGETDKRKAREYEAAEKAKVRRLIQEAAEAGRKPMTVAIAFDRWWNEVGAFGKDPDIRRALDWLAAQLGPQVMLQDLSDDDVSKAVTARRQCVLKAGREKLPAPKRKGSRRKFVEGQQLYRPISNRTVNKTVPSLLSRVLNRAAKAWKAIVPAEMNWDQHYLPVPRRPVREIKPAEDERLDQVESAEYAALREFAEIMGLRRRELLLTWPQVDFDQATITIIGKGNKPAILPLSQRAYEILWTQRGHDKMHVFTFIAERTRRCPKTGRHFVKGQRYPMTYYGIGTNRRRKWPKAGVDARLHDTRHTTGQRTLRATGNLKLVKDLLRHSDIRTTERFYTDTTMNDLRGALEATQESRKNPRTITPVPAKPLKGKA